MTSKVVVPKRIANVLRLTTGFTGKSKVFTDVMSDGTGDRLRASYGHDISILRDHFGADHDKLMKALVNGWEVEKSPEDRLLEYYLYLRTAEETTFQNGNGSGSQFRQGWQTVKKTLDILGIKIEGVNA